MELFRYDLSSCRNRVLAIRDRDLLDKVCECHDHRANGVLGYLYLDPIFGYRLLLFASCRMKPLRKFEDNFTYHMVSSEVVKYDDAILPEKGQVKLDLLTREIIANTKTKLIDAVLKKLSGYDLPGWTIRRSADES